MFLVGAFSLKERSPTITVGSFFQPTISLNGPLFLQFLQSYNFCNTYLAYEVVFLHHLRNSTGPKGTPLEWDFSKKITKGSPLQFFDIFRQKGCWKIPKSPPFSFFRHCETFFFIFFLKGSPIHPNCLFVEWSQPLFHSECEKFEKS